MATNKLSVRVIRARGHGPNSLFPHEEAWLELWANEDADSKAETSKKRSTEWDEVCQLNAVSGKEGSSDEHDINTLHVRMRGRLPAHQGIDEIGSGSLALAAIEAPGATKPMKVPLYASNGKEAGEVELEIMPL